MKKIEAPYLLFALIFGFVALMAPYLMEEHRLTLEGRVAMLLFQAGMVLACSLATAKHLHDKWVQEDILERQARLRMPKPQEDEDLESAPSPTSEGEIPEPIPTPAAAQDSAPPSAAGHASSAQPPAH